MLDFVFEILFEIYMELMMLVVPEEKACEKRYRALAGLVAMIFTFGIIFLFLWGLALIEENKSDCYFAVFGAVALSLAQIIAGIIIHSRKKD